MRFSRLTLSLIFLLAIAFPFFSEAIVISDIEYNNIKGWAWSDNIGWVSFSCHTSESESLGNPGGEVENCVNDWGAHMVMEDEANVLGIPSKTIIGHAWSDNLGWISFEKLETGTPPLTDNTAFDSQFSNSSHLAKFNPDSNRVIGWARVLSACASIPCLSLIDSNWDGWIQFIDTIDGVKIDNDGNWSGFAWGGEVVGWLQFDTSRGAYTGEPVGSLSVNNPPTAIADIVTNISSIGGNFIFTADADASSSFDPDFGENTTLTYSWDWGDGSISSGVISSHIYSDEGVYDITLTVTDINGDFSTVNSSTTFTSPSIAACLIECNADSDCDEGAGNVCFFPSVGESGFCIAGPEVTIPGEGGTAPTIIQAPAPYDCTPSNKQVGVLSVCSPKLEFCSGGSYIDGSLCNEGEYRPSTIASDFECGINSDLGPFCTGPELSLCPESGVCSSDLSSCVPGQFSCELAIGVYRCVEEETKTKGTVGGYNFSLPVKKQEPRMPIGLQPGGEACTKPTADAPNNCEGINGCLYYSFQDNGDRIGNDSVANCVGSSVSGDLELSGCTYYSSTGEVNVCQNDYPTGCIYYAGGLVNCLPLGSFAGLPDNCVVAKSGNRTTVDCSDISAAEVGASSGRGCVFDSDGIINCTFPNATSYSYSGCIYDPNPEGGISCPGVASLSYDVTNFTGCVLTNTSLSSLSDPVNACSNDGTCPGQNEICLSGSCVTLCDDDVSGSCDVGKTCVSPCPTGEVWNSTTSQCELSTWLTLPDCQGVYLKDVTTENELNIFSSLAVGVTQTILGIKSDEDVVCKYSTDPLDIYSSSTMTLFTLTGGLLHETLVSGLAPLPELNRYLVRCQESGSGSETPACKMTVRVGQQCSSDLDCSTDQFCNNTTNYCEYPTCSGAIPSFGTILPAGTGSAAIGMDTRSPSEVSSVCRYDTDVSLDFSNMGNVLNTPDNLNHSAEVSALVSGHNTYYVECQDLTTNQVTGVQDISNKCKIDFKVAATSGCNPGAICPNGALCPANGVCPGPTACSIGTICPTGAFCPKDGVCPPPGGCSPGTICPNGALCPANGVCPSCPVGTNFNVTTSLCEGGLNCPAGTSFNSLSGLCETGGGPEVVLGNVCNVLGIEFQGTAPGSGIGPTGNCSILAVILALVNWFAWLVSLFAVVYGLRGGYLYITSSGEQAKLDESKKYIMYTVVGVIVAILSFSIIAIARSVAGI